MEKKFALIKKRKLKQTSAHDTKEDEVEEEEEEEMWTVLNNLENKVKCDSRFIAPLFERVNKR